MFWVCLLFEVNLNFLGFKWSCFFFIEYDCWVYNKMVCYFENKLFYFYLLLEKYIKWLGYLGIFRMESVFVYVLVWCYRIRYIGWFFGS